MLCPFLLIVSPLDGPILVFHFILPSYSIPSDRISTSFFWNVKWCNVNTPHAMPHIDVRALLETRHILNTYNKINKIRKFEHRHVYDVWTWCCYVSLNVISPYYQSLILSNHFTYFKNYLEKHFALGIVNIIFTYYVSKCINTQKLKVKLINFVMTFSFELYQCQKTNPKPQHSIHQFPPKE